MCDPKWSNRDTFEIYSDCHIYQPASILLNVLIFFVSIICFSYGVHQTIYQKRKGIPISALFLGFFLTVTYGIVLGAKITFADRNLGLNILHGLGRAATWVNVNLSSFRSLEVIMSVDKRTVAKSHVVHKSLMKFNVVAGTGSLIIEILIAVIATVMNLKFYSILGPASITLTWLNAIPQALYAHKLRVIIESAQNISRDSKFYNPIKQKLNRVVVSIVIAIIFGSMLTLCMLFVPIFRLNLYVPYNIQLMMCPLTGIVSLNDYRGNTKSEIGKTDKITAPGGSSSRDSKTITAEMTTRNSTRGTISGKPKSQQLQHSQSGREGLLPFIEEQDPLPSHEEQQPQKILHEQQPQLPTEQQALNSNESTESSQEDDYSMLTTPKKIWNPFHFTNPASPSTQETITEESHYAVEPPSPQQIELSSVD